MAEVTDKELTVKQFAEMVGMGTTPELLLKQLNEAGVAVSNIEQTVSEEGQKKLLMHLRSSHGSTEPIVKPKKITIKRKSVSVVQSGNKRVNVEVRAKRTFVKPTIPEEEKETLEQPIVEAESEQQAVQTEPV